MKIDVNQIPPEGLTLREEFTAAGLDLETDIIKFSGPIRATAKVSRITNAITVHLALKTAACSTCSRCLDAIATDFEKELELNFPVNKLEPVIDLNPHIREEIILDYPLKPLCRPDCKGLCLKCGKNLNEGKCNC